MSKTPNAIYGRDGYGAQPELPNRHLSGQVYWLLQVSWQGSDDFGSQIEPPLVRSVRWLRGAERLLDEAGTALAQPDDEWLEVTVADPSGRYDPLNQASPVFSGLGRPGLPMRLLVLGSDLREPAQPVFTGTLAAMGSRGQAGSCTLRATGCASRLKAAVWAPSQPISANGWDAAFVADGSTPVPICYWRGQAGGLGLQNGMRLLLNLAGASIQASQNTQPLPPPQPEYMVPNGQSAWALLKQLAGAYAARLFFTRQGNLFAMPPNDPNGLHAGISSPGAALLAPASSPGNPFGSLRNQLAVMVSPLSVPPFSTPLKGDSYALCWSARGPIAVPPASQQFLDLRFDDSDGRVFAANLLRVNSDSPLEQDALRVNSQADGQGLDMGPVAGNGEGDFSLVLAAAGTNQDGTLHTQVGGTQSGCRVCLRNHSTSRTAYFFNLRVLGQGVSRASQSGGVYQYAQDAASMALNGSQGMTVANRLVQTNEQAQAVAVWLLRRLSSRAGASLATLGYRLHGLALYQAMLAHQPGTHWLPPQGAQASVGPFGRQLVVAQQLVWNAADGQQASLRLTLQPAEPKLPQPVSLATAQLAWQQNAQLQLGQAGRLVLFVASDGAQTSAASLGGQPLALAGHSAAAQAGAPRVEVWTSQQELPAGTLQLQMATPANAFVAAVSLRSTLAAGPFGPLYGQTGSKDAFEQLAENLPGQDLLLGLLCANTPPVPDGCLGLAQGVFGGGWHCQLAWRPSISQVGRLAWHAPQATGALAALVVRGLPDEYPPA